VSDVIGTLLIQFSLNERGRVLAEIDVDAREDFSNELVVVNALFALDKLASELDTI
jgi:hypothetical protein